ncbi:MAG: hypothetical protein NVS9B5_27610 [Terriglobales bacterium]
MTVPGGTLSVEGTGRVILEICDGELTVLQMIQELQGLYGAADPSRIQQEVFSFLQQLHEQQVVDY